MDINMALQWDRIGSDRSPSFRLISSTVLYKPDQAKPSSALWLPVRYTRSFFDEFGAVAEPKAGPRSLHLLTLRSSEERARTNEQTDGRSALVFFFSVGVAPSRISMNPRPHPPTTNRTICSSPLFAFTESERACAEDERERFETRSPLGSRDSVPPNLSPARKDLQQSSRLHWYCTVRTVPFQALRSKR